MSDSKFYHYAGLDKSTVSRTIDGLVTLGAVRSRP